MERGAEKGLLGQELRRGWKDRVRGWRRGESGEEGRGRKRGEDGGEGSGEEGGDERKQN